jgi:hypothetical protein
MKDARGAVQNALKVLSQIPGINEGKTATTTNESSNQ